MRITTRHRSLAASVLTLLLFFGRGTAYAGPPYQTDDPEPVEYRHYEVYIGADEDVKQPAREGDIAFVEANYGPWPNVQIALTLPQRFSNSEGGMQSGAGDAEFGIKYRFLQERRRWPQVAFYPSIAMPLGTVASANSMKLTLPIWGQKSNNRWTYFGGAAYHRNRGGKNRDYWFEGAAASKELSMQTSIGVELYHQSATSSDETASSAWGVGFTQLISAHMGIVGSAGTSLGGPSYVHAYVALQLVLGPKEQTNSSTR